MTISGFIKRTGFISLFLLLIGPLMIVGLSGCERTKSIEDQGILIAAGETIVTVGDFNKALEVSKTAYTYNVLQNPESYKKIKSRLLKQMAEEVVLLKIADDKQITVSDQELQAAINTVKADYPEGEFEDVLLENAISYSVWQDRMKRRLLLEKVIEDQWGKTIEVSPEEMTAYYEKYYTGDTLDEDYKENPEKIYSKLVKRLKSEKTEMMYQKWIEEKKDYYSIEVNEKVWEKIICLKN